MRHLTEREIQLHKDAGGGYVQYDAIMLEERMPTVEEIRHCAKLCEIDDSQFTDEVIAQMVSGEHAVAMSLPNKVIYVPTHARGYDNEKERLCLIAHEIEHQSQYWKCSDGTTIFSKLIEEAFQAQTAFEDKSVPDPYRTPGYLEYEAQQVENAALKIV